MTISLAFLAPDLVRAAIEGRLPHGMGVVRLADLPADIKARLAGLGVEPMSMTSAAFGKFIVDETEKWGKVIQAANIKVE